MVAAILTSKYGNHVPLDRQARSFNDNDINIATNTLANWVINSSDTYLSLLYERMHKCIGPFTIGRKNYLFCESVNGAKASVIIYNIVETAKANGLNVYKYLEFLITELSECKKDSSLDYIDNLLPCAKTPQKECKVPIEKS